MAHITNIDDHFVDAHVAPVMKRLRTLDRHILFSGIDQHEGRYFFQINRDYDMVIDRQIATVIVTDDTITFSIDGPFAFDMHFVAEELAAYSQARGYRFEIDQKGDSSQSFPNLFRKAS